jgi:hypothetical protein
MLVFLGEQGIVEEVRTFAVGLGKCVDDVDDVDGHSCGGSSDCAIHDVSHDSQLQPAIREREKALITYSIPTRKMAMTLNLLLTAMCNPQILGIGNDQMNKSMMKSEIAYASRNCSCAVQCSATRATGAHAYAGRAPQRKMAPIPKLKVQKITIAIMEVVMVLKASLLVFLTQKILR